MAVVDLRGRGISVPADIAMREQIPTGNDHRMVLARASSEKYATYCDHGRMPSDKCLSCAMEMPCRVAESDSMARQTRRAFLGAKSAIGVYKRRRVFYIRPTMSLSHAGVNVAAGWQV
jgi:hypothetical protein